MVLIQLCSCSSSAAIIMVPPLLAFANYEVRMKRKCKFFIAHQCSTQCSVLLVQSCAYQFGQPLFQDCEETIHCAKINAISYEPPWCFSLRKFFFFFLKNKIQNGRLKKKKKGSFSSSANSQNFFPKISWIGRWVSRIDWCEGHRCGSTYMAVRLSDISSKTA